jgi:hypothetical protein
VLEAGIAGALPVVEVVERMALAEVAVGDLAVSILLYERLALALSLRPAFALLNLRRLSVETLVTAVVAG